MLNCLEAGKFQEAKVHTRQVEHSLCMKIVETYRLKMLLIIQVVLVLVTNILTLMEYLQTVLASKQVVQDQTRGN